MKSIIDKPFGLLLLFCGLLGIELFVFYLLIDTGLLQTLLAEDYSFISRAILAIPDCQPARGAGVVFTVNRE